MKSEQSKPREVREEMIEKGRDIINIYRSILPFLPSLPSILPLACREKFLCDIAHYILSLPHPICFFKGRKGRVAFTSVIASVFPLPLDLKFKGRVREERREER
jgi:hypothetical protein